MPAMCECVNGHVFSSGLEEVDPETNSIVVADECCPECGAEFEIVELYDDYEYAVD